MHRIPPAIALIAAALPLSSADSLIRIDARRQVSRADLVYDTPASRKEEGMPVGNGRMGSLIWTTPSALRLQINRVDVHAMDSTTFSFPRADSDYGSVCGFVDVNVADAGDDVFASGSFRQHLSLYDALMTAQGKRVTARAVALPNSDVIAIEIDDQRAQPEAIRVELRMLRYQGQYEKGRNAQLLQEHASTFRTAAHVAASNLGIHGQRITLTQQFREDSFFGASAVAIGISGRTSRARYLNESAAQISVPPARGRFTIWIGSAAADRVDRDVAADALQQVKSAAARSFEDVRRETAGWWSNFWSQGAVYMHSESGQADFVEANYDYFLYLMASSSRGDFPPRFGGLLWFTDGDMSRWGSQYWWANTSAYYNNLMPANRMELMDPLFKLYTGMLDAAALAARQQWGTKGIWIPETTFFNGPEKLPEQIARELQDLSLSRKPMEEQSGEFMRYANNKNRHNSRWNFRADGDWKEGYYVFQSKGSGAFGHTSHILGVAARLGNLAWQKYQFTRDEKFLREQAYPIIRGAAEFYRNFPNLQKDESGVYHINHTNSGESAWNSRDAPYEVTCMHLIFPLAARAAEILDVDADLQPQWREIKEHLVAAPAGRTGAAAGAPYGSFVYNGPGAIEPAGPQAEWKRRFLGFTRLGSFIDPSGIGGAQIFRNRLRLREGPGAIDAEHIAGLSMGIHTTMLDSHPDSLTNQEPVSILNQWPADWDAAFRLLARGGFLVSAAQIGGKTPLVEVVSQLGGEFRLANPWKEERVTLYRNGRKAEELSGEPLVFATSKGETVTAVPRNTTPAPVTVN